MNYSSVFAFALVSLAGWLGVSHIVTQDEVAMLIDNIIQVAGLIGVFIARYKQGNITPLGFKK